MIILYTIKGENQTLRVFELKKATKELRRINQLKKGYVVIQSWDTGQTAHIQKNKLIFNQTIYG